MNLIQVWNVINQTYHIPTAKDPLMLLMMSVPYFLKMIKTV